MNRLLLSGLTASILCFSSCCEALGKDSPLLTADHEQNQAAIALPAQMPAPPPTFLPPPINKEQESKADPQSGFQTVFTPFENGTKAYIDFLEEHCHKSLYVADYTFTSPAIADEYCKLAQQGVAVHVILDLSQTRAVKTEMALIEQLKNAGVEVIVTTSPYKHAIMHCKFSVADNEWIEDGSWNYTNAADNQCNFLNFNTTASPQRARVFLQAWNKIQDYAAGHTY